MTIKIEAPGTGAPAFIPSSNITGPVDEPTGLNQEGGQTPEQDLTSAQVAQELLTWWYGDAPAVRYLLSYQYPGRKFSNSAHATIEGMAAAADQHERNGAESVWFRMTTVRRVVDVTERGLAKDSQSLVGLWADLDFQGDGHKSQKLPANEEEAQACVSKAGLPEPSAWVHTGGGLVPYWKLTTPLDTTTDEGMGRAQALSNGWIAQLKAGNPGIKIDSVQDLSHVMRLPGTTNRKPERVAAGTIAPCRVLSMTDTTFTVEGLEKALEAARETTVGAEIPSPRTPPVNGHARASGAPSDPFMSAPKRNTKRPAQAQKQWRDGIARFEAMTTSGSSRGDALFNLANELSHGIRANPPQWSESELRDALYSAATRNGLVDSRPDGHDYVMNRNITNGIELGINEPWEILPDLPGQEEPQRETTSDGKSSEESAHQDDPPTEETDPDDETPDDLDVPDMETVREELAAIEDVADKKSRAREIAYLVAHAELNELARQEWKHLLKVLADLSGREFDAMVSEAKRERKRAKRAKQSMPKGPQGIELPSPSAPSWVAERLVDLLEATDDMPHWAWWKSDFYKWTGAHWSALDKDEVRGWLYARTTDAHYMAEDGDDGPTPKAWMPTKSKIDNVLDAMGVWKLQRTGDAEKAIACTNGVLELEDRTLSTHHPRRFNLYSLSFPYDSDADCPQWKKFLDQVLPGDETGQAFLQEWFGYVISGRTDLQKMASLVGAPRSGKGTISLVLETMIGAESVASPSLEKLGTQFGEQSLIGKRLAVMSDVRWNARDAGSAIPVLLAITGEDSREIPRKMREDWHGRLSTVFLCMSNDPPTFTDASGAMAGRMIHVKFPISFQGREDYDLQPRLLTELSGILNWALAGLDRLNQQRRFTVPETSADIDREVRHLANPVYAFVQECCVLDDPFAKTNLIDFYLRFMDWCEESGQKSSTLSRQMVSAKLKSAFPGIIARPDTRVTTHAGHTKKTTVFEGIRLDDSSRSTFGNPGRH